MLFDPDTEQHIAIYDYKEIHQQTHYCYDDRIESYLCYQRYFNDLLRVITEPADRFKGEILEYQRATFRLAAKNLATARGEVQQALEVSQERIALKVLENAYYVVSDVRNRIGDLTENESCKNYEKPGLAGEIARLTYILFNLIIDLEDRLVDMIANPQAQPIAA